MAWLARISAQMPVDKIIHASIDDVEFSDLIANAANYASIWDAPMFSALKTAHESSGACFTLNCFTSVTGSDITALPEKAAWQEELQAVSSWLRFAFHAREDSQPAANTSLLADYSNFLTGIRKLVGNDGSFDRMVRLGNFAGTKAQLIELRDAANGYVGFLGGDSSSRASYYLSADDSARLWAHGMFLDPESRLVFLKSFGRMDTTDVAAQQANIQAAIPHSAKIVELFIHFANITTRLSRITSTVTWATQNGFVNAFPSDAFV